jgi:hypothetical protein
MSRVAIQVVLHIVLITGYVCAADGAQGTFIVASDKDFHTALAASDVTFSEVVADIKLTDEVRSRCFHGLIFHASYNMASICCCTHYVE